MGNNIKYIIRVEVNTLKGEEVLNTCIQNKIHVSKVRRVNKALLSFETYYEDYKDLVKITKRYGGKIKVIEEKGNIIKIKRIKNRIGLLIGGVLFVIMLFTLSRFVWAIDIETEKKLSPFEVREVLLNIGVEQGMLKSEIDVYEIEKAIEDKCNDVLWTRVRIEGSTLNIVVKEKINPPANLEENEGDVYAKIGGEVKRIYAQKGTAIVKPGDIVKEGDVLIEGYMEGNGEIIESKAIGKVVANTFYTKEVEIDLDGGEEVRGEKSENEYYLNIFGKKIYLKKFSNSFEKYDKIEEENGFFNKNIYYEKKTETIKKDRNEIEKDVVKELKELLEKELPIDTKIINQKVDTFELGGGKIKIIVEFTVEQNIANR
ncbi:MAG: sporulation protein YqfD [Clostridium sp.]|uniref:sporulation protein YqfD n=1 Tax=Clostridium sp. TaxID=1506 RepID=UPI003F2F28D6